MNGIINVYKEAGYTSFDVVAIMRRLLHIKKIGHTGTLDPQATGVLPICIGKGTRVVSLLTDYDKTYRGTCRLGVRTDTQDIWGTILEEETVNRSLEQVIDGLESFVGEYSQIPPMYSALKKNGKKLYELARQGIEVEREPRLVTIHRIYDIEQVDDVTFSFTVTCSKGTYIRTLIDDLGKKLGTCATMTALCRLEVGPFNHKDARTLSELEQIDVSEALIPVEKIFDDYPKLVVSSDYDGYVHNGNKLPHELVPKALCEHKSFRVYDSKEQFIGIYNVKTKEENTYLKVEKMFY